MNGTEVWELGVERLVLTPVMCVLCVVTVLGNSLVVAAVLTRRYLQSPTHYLIVSMAVADLIVGLIVMPVAILQQLNSHQWAFGLAFCDIWHGLDILACTASIWNLSVISLDRYFAINNPLTYWDVITNIRVYGAIGLVWLGSILISFPAIAWWRHVSPELYLDPGACLMTSEWSYVVPASIIAYYIPLGIIFFAYSRIFVIASQHQSSLSSGRGAGDVEMRVHRGGASQVEEDRDPAPLAARTQTYSMLAGTRAIMRATFVHTQLMQAQDSIDDDDDLCQSDDDDYSSASATKSPSPKQKNPSTESSPLMSSPRGSLHNSKHLGVINGGSHSLLSGPGPKEGFPGGAHPGAHLRPQGSDTGSVAAKRKSRRRKKGLFRKFIREQRAAQTLGIVVGCFVLCWAPFFVTNMVMTACSTCLQDARLVLTFITWLGYLNSALNPLIYGCFNRQFRRAFGEMVCCVDSKAASQAAVSTLHSTNLKLHSAATNL